MGENPFLKIAQYLETCHSDMVQEEHNFDFFSPAHSFAKGRFYLLYCMP
jgi:hypothetical protein